MAAKRKVPEGLRANYEALGKLLQPRFSSPVSRIVTATAEVCFQMALRGPANPISFLPSDLSPAERTEILQAVASECNIVAGQKWLLKDEIRQRTLRSRLPKDVASALASAQPADDEVTKALRSLYSTPLPDPAKLTAEEAKALISARGWTEGHAPFTIDDTDLRRHLAHKERENEYRRLVSAGFFGRDSEKAGLIEFFTSALGAYNGRYEFHPDAGQVHVTHVFGPGGIGKSTLVAAAALAVLEADAQAALVHLDFDRSTLDPTKSATLDLEVLYQVDAADKERAEDFRGRRERIREQFEFPSSGGAAASSLESSYASSRSVMSGALAWLSDLNKPLLLILDTFEQVEAGGPQYLDALMNWLGELVWISNAPEVRIVVSSRSDPRETLSFAHAPEQSIVTLPELDLAGTLAFLKFRSVPEDVGTVIFDTFGGNPLMLRIAAELLLKAGRSALDEIVRKAREGEFPREIVQGFLYDRFLKHIPPEGRDYAHPGLILPEITRPLIQHVLGPLRNQSLVNDTIRTDAIFNALASATWLVSVSTDGQTITQRRDLRRLMLKLMESDDARRNEVPEVRRLAIEYHRSRQTPKDDAMRVYHLLMAVKNKDELQEFDGTDFTVLAEFLRPHLADLPEIARTNVQSRLQRRLGSEEAIQQLTDEAWGEYLAGSAHAIGEGDRIVEASDPMIALNLWRRRPIRVNGLIPTFVIQALAETGEWFDPAAEEVMDAIEPSQIESDGKRLYWLARLQLLRKPTEMPESLRDGLKAALDPRSNNSSIKEIAILVAIADSVAGTTLIAPDVLTNWAPSSDTRLSLLRVLRGIRDWSRDTLIYEIPIQRRWTQRLAPSRLAPSRNWPLELLATQADIDRLHGQPLDMVIAASRPFMAEVAGDLTPEAAVILLRGTTPEFHRPVRQALRESMLNEDALRTVMTRFRKALSICPSDLEPDVFVPRAMRDPATWFLSLAQFADRARTMETLLDTALEHAPSNNKLVKVRESWIAWDRGICQGRSSSWQTSSPVTPYLTRFQSYRTPDKFKDRKASPSDGLSRAARVKTAITQIVPDATAPGVDAAPELSSGLQKTAAAREYELTDEELFGLEAIVLPINRPAIFVRNHSYDDAADPWTILNTPVIRARLSRSLPSIGRIELPTSPLTPFPGTAIVVGSGLVMTTRHVAELISSTSQPNAFIDFQAEITGSPSSASRFPVQAVEFLHPHWDMALLRVASLPNDGILRLSVRSPDELEGRQIVVIGHPTFDPRNDGWLQDRIFSNIYNIKRLTPGVLRPSVKYQSMKAMTHDASTLGLNSGAAVVDLETGEVVGLHFANEYLKANYAVPMYELARDSRVTAKMLNFDGTLTPTNDWEPSRLLTEDTEVTASSGRSQPGPSAPLQSTAPTQAAPVPLAQMPAPNVSTSMTSATWTIPIHVTVTLGDAQQAVQRAALVPIEAETAQEGVVVNQD
jgi:Trypsin-like peptidase domain/AAA ATPase domain